MSDPLPSQTTTTHPKTKGKLAAATVTEWELGWKIFIILVMLTISGTTIVKVWWNWDTVKKQETPPDYIKIWLPLICLIVILVTMIYVAWNHKRKIMFAMILAGITGLSIWFDMNWKKEKEKKWDELWPIWGIVGPSALIILLFLVFTLKRSVQFIAKSRG